MLYNNAMFFAFLDICVFAYLVFIDIRQFVKDHVHLISLSLRTLVI